MRTTALPILLLIILAGCNTNNEKEEGNSAFASDTTKPETNRFIPVTLTPEGSLDEPMMFQLSRDGTAFIIERKGGLKKYDPVTRAVSLVATIPVFTGNEQGLIGIALDPGFEENHWIYLQYAPEDKSVFRLERYELVNDRLVEGSAKVLLEIPVDRENTSHTGGGTAWDSDGNLYLTVGNNTGNGLLAQTDERSGRENFDDQRGASNTNDLRGKILRIHPEPDGTYTVPEGNLFPKGTEKTRPEIYVMGTRNPYRIAVNPVTSVVYWGEIGPDAGQDSTRGPKGYDEFNQAKKPGNFGWPYFVGFNKAYAKWDFATLKAGPLFDPAKPVNNSPNNTGLNELPPAMPPFIAYPYIASEQFPELGSGGRCAIGGDFYKYDENASSPYKFPKYYDGTLFIADWMRNWVFNVQFDEEENFKRNEPFMPLTGDFRRPIDMAFGKDGLLYMLEYGSVYGATNEDARLVKIEYYTGNRPPVAKANILDSVITDSLSRTRFLTSEANRVPVVKEIAGQAPLKIRVSSRGSRDLDDNDSVSYQWTFNENDTVITTRDARYTYTKPGIYKVVLTASDRQGLSAHDTLVVKVGNTKPDVRITSAG